MYKFGKQKKRRAPKIIIWFMVIVILSGGGLAGFMYVRSLLKPQTTIKNGKASITKISFDTQQVTYNEPDFTIQLPKGWAQISAPAGTYKTYNWTISDHQTNGDQLTVYEDSIPTNLAVNRELIVSGDQLTQLTVDGAASDNCSNYTLATGYQSATVGAPARWQGVNFFCDQQNPERDVLGTSSTTAPNTVVLKNTYGATHKFFFTYSNHSLNPDYTIFYTALQSLRMK